MLVSKNARICELPPKQTQICITPNGSRWNIGGFGPPTWAAGIGHVDFMCSFHLCWVTNTNSVSNGIWALLIDNGSPGGALYLALYLWIDNGYFGVNSLAFTFLLISP